MSNESSKEASKLTFHKSASQRLNEYIKDYEKQKSFKIACSIINCCDSAESVETFSIENIKSSNNIKSDCDQIYSSKCFLKESNDCILNNDLSVYDLLSGNLQSGEPVEPSFYDVNKNYDKVEIKPKPSFVYEQFNKENSVESQKDLVSLMKDKKVKNKSSTDFIPEYDNFITNELLNEEKLSQSFLNKTENMSYIMEDIEKRTKKLLENPDDSTFSSSVFYRLGVEEPIVNSSCNFSD